MLSDQCQRMEKNNATTSNVDIVGASTSWSRPCKAYVREKSESGSIAIEFAIICPILLMLIIAGLDLGLALLSANRLNFAAEAGARCQAIGAAPCPNAAATATYAAQIAQLDGASFVVTQSACGVHIIGSWSYESMVLPTIPISAAACYP